MRTLSAPIPRDRRLLVVVAIVCFAMGCMVNYADRCAVRRPVLSSTSHGDQLASIKQFCPTPLAMGSLPRMQETVPTMLSKERRANVVELTKRVLHEGIAGDILEAGVWQGGASILMKAVLDAHCSDKHIYACDSYRGLPPLTNKDKSLPEEQAKPMDPKGSYSFAGGVETVKSNFAKFGVLDDRVHFVVGYFNETLPKLKHKPKRLSLLRMDGDMYSSTIDILANLYDRLEPGGYCIIDDYGHWPQCRAAVQDFFKARGESHVLDQLQRIDDTGVWFKKP